MIHRETAPMAIELIPARGGRGVRRAIESALAAAPNACWPANHRCAVRRHERFKETARRARLFSRKMGSPAR
jgi:hypothetical protein